MEKYIIRKRRNKTNNRILLDCGDVAFPNERIYLVETIANTRTAFTKAIETEMVCFKCYRDKYKENSQFAKELE